MEENSCSGRYTKRKSVKEAVLCGNVSLDSDLRGGSTSTLDQAAKSS